MSVTQLPPMPAIPEGLAEDERYRGITPAMDKAIDALHQDGWSIARLFTRPNAALPLPPKFPPGRSYLFADTVAVVVHNSNGGVVSSLPAVAALQTLHQYTPDLLADDDWAAARWEQLGSSGPIIDPHPRWWKQSWFDKDGSIVQVRRTDSGGAVIYRDRRLVREVKDDNEAEDLGFHPITVEMVAHVTGAA